ncbi:MAG: thiamine-phosphate kinase [Candidatus Omnitrophota bacterium]|nr:thiamine-phosphate kinase [Candidatus Omnitrophota bacterium]
MRLSDLGEEGLIRRIARTIRMGPSVVKGIGDDCAVLKGSGRKLKLFASDMLVEGVHFTRDAPGTEVGWKALAVNVSDLAAMGGGVLPRQAVISLGLPPATPVSFVDGLYRGLRRCAKAYGVDLVGGDTARSPVVVVNVAILGEANKEDVVYRSGARPGDALLVTGRLGGSLKSGRHLRFRPRLREAQALTVHAKLHAMMDLSDGLGPDLLKMCEASGVSAILESVRIPRNAGCSLGQALNDGEDFELLIAAAPRDAERLTRSLKKPLRCGLRRIGTVVAKKGKPAVTLIPPTGSQPLRSLAGFRHF